jgi:hypothetical protein
LFQLFNFYNSNPILFEHQNQKKMLLYIFSFVLIFIFFRIFIINNERKNVVIKTLVVLGSGGNFYIIIKGHTAEMTNIIKSLDKDKYKFEFILANNDKNSENFIKNSIDYIKYSNFHKIPVNIKIKINREVEMYINHILLQYLQLFTQFYILLFSKYYLLNLSKF